MTLPRRVALVGPTASGKSAAAHAAARAHGATEIVAMDAMTAYRAMDLATAKPTRAERAEVRYHLIDVVDASEEMTVGRFSRLYATALADIASRGATALLVGGSGLYVRAAVDGLSIPPSAPEVRDVLEAQAAQPGGPTALYDELARIDPLAAARIDPRNVRRTVRALEVVRATARPFSSFGRGIGHFEQTDVVQLGIAFNAERTDAAIAARFASWLEVGLLDEVRALAGAPHAMSRTARQAAGYKELLDYVEGRVELDAAVDAAVAATRRLARRQWRWFRRDPRITWVHDADAARDAVAQALRAAHD